MVYSELLAIPDEVELTFPLPVTGTDTVLYTTLADIEMLGIEEGVDVKEPEVEVVNVGNLLCNALLDALR